MPPDRPILAFDTSAAHCAAAVLSGGRIVAARHEEMAKGQAERLMPMLVDCLAEAGLAWADLGAVAVGTGPGNFTGVRLSVAAARGLALALSVPAHGVTRFEALALGQPRPCLVALDARQGRLYLQPFRPGPEAARMAGVDDPRGLEGLKGLAVAGDAAALAAAWTGGPVLPPVMPLAEAIARVAAGRGDGPAPRPAPLYLRAADAAPPRETPPAILS
ncbi:MAG: tRNA (adenosine(37)-N6)-threonylcarbamoyltransferase complex dimerization subunit type 1 TsaB [Proteobacteria bacterium]|nr:tRNA (adenosine(37)-N6)-threonylcarbamoyltransferase complex dimerization subunit type 1 TsaB [Pseudomonadota bacterium]MBS0572632.1 tRNA (adenosine(37)-N6)-threonylcarbamoyltransferase complex dimerization subunit type 1 TsaB [Pseudomonadota bacterium]